MTECVTVPMMVIITDTRRIHQRDVNSPLYVIGKLVSCVKVIRC